MKIFQVPTVYSVDSLFERYAGEVCSRPAPESLPIPKQHSGIDGE